MKTTTRAARCNSCNTRYSVDLLYQYKSTNADTLNPLQQLQRHHPQHAEHPGTPFTCFTSTKVHILTRTLNPHRARIQTRSAASAAATRGTEFTFFTGTAVQILTQLPPLQQQQRPLHQQHVAEHLRVAFLMRDMLACKAGVPVFVLLYYSASVSVFVLLH